MHVHLLDVNYRYSCLILMELEIVCTDFRKIHKYKFSRKMLKYQISLKHSNIKFQENLSAGSRVCPIRQTDRQT